MLPSLDQAWAARAAQAFSRLLGAQLNRFGPDGVELEVPVRPEHRAGCRNSFMQLVDGMRGGVR